MNLYLYIFVLFIALYLLLFAAAIYTISVQGIYKDGVVSHSTLYLAYMLFHYCRSLSAWTQDGLLYICSRSYRHFHNIAANMPATFVEFGSVPPKKGL